MTINVVALDQEIQRWLSERALDPTAADTSITGIRTHARQVNARSRALLKESQVSAVESPVRLDLPSGVVPGRIYRPEGTPPLPTVVFFHGGGWIAGDLETHAQHARRLCERTPAVVLSVDYRLAPEHRYPDAFVDCMAVTRWAAREVAELGGDRTRLAVAGDSAGGQLAASVAIGCRAEQLALAAQLLIVPATDVRGRYLDATRNAAYPSRIDNATGLGLTTAAMQEFVDMYGIEESSDWRASPLCAPTLAGVAPAVVYTAGFDPLRDEGAAYARRLRTSGVPVVHREWPTLNHGFFSLGGVSPVAERAAGQACRDLGELLAREPHDS